MNRKESLTVVIPTLNRPGYLEKCLASIAKQTVMPEECIIVDQSDNEKTRELFEATDLGPTRKVYAHQKTKSLILARNNGIKRAAKTEFLCFLDDDLELFPDFFEKLMHPFRAYPERDYAGGMGTFEALEWKRDRFSEFFLLPHYGSGKFLTNGQPTFPHWKQEFCEVEFLSGGITMYRTEIIKRFMFDERLIGYGYGDDVDVSYRVSREYKLFYEPKAKCKHDTHSTGRDPGKIHRKYQLQNAYYLMEKNVGRGLKHKMAFAWLVLGQTIHDVRCRRFGATLGDLLGTINILRGNLDSVIGYSDFKASLEREK